LLLLERVFVRSVQPGTDIDRASGGEGSDGRSVTMTRFTSRNVTTIATAVAIG